MKHIFLFFFGCNQSVFKAYKMCMYTIFSDFRGYCIGLAPIDAHTCIHTYMHACIHRQDFGSTTKHDLSTATQTYIFSYIHTYIHTNIKLRYDTKHYHIPTQGLTLSTAGVASSFTVSMRDVYGASLYDNVGRLGLFTSTSTLLPSVSISIFSTTATQTITYMSTRSGDYSLRVCGATGNGLAAEYFADSLMTAPVYTTKDSAVDFNWATGVPGSRFLTGDVTQPGGFAVRWTGYVWSVLPQVHTFSAVMAGADERARLWIDDSLIVDQVRVLAVIVCVCLCICLRPCPCCVCAYLVFVWMFD